MPNPHTFPLSAGDIVKISVSSEMFNPVLTVYRPDASVFMEVTGEISGPEYLAVADFHVPITGQWSVMVASDDAEAIGDYDFHLECGAAPSSRILSGTALVEFDSESYLAPLLVMSGKASITFSSAEAVVVLDHDIGGVSPLTIGSSMDEDVSHVELPIVGQKVSIIFGANAQPCIDQVLSGISSVDFDSQIAGYGNFSGICRLGFGSDADFESVHWLNSGIIGISFGSSAEAYIYSSISGRAAVVFGTFNGECSPAVLLGDATVITADSSDITADQIIGDECIQLQVLAGRSFIAFSTHLSFCESFNETIVMGDGELGLAFESMPSGVVVGVGGVAAVLGVGFDIGNEDFVAYALWEAQDQEPEFGLSMTLSPATPGVKLVDVEVLLVDGRRLYLRTTYNALGQVNPEIEDFTDPEAADVKAWFSFDVNANADTGSGSFTLSGSAAIDAASWVWDNRPSGAALACTGPADTITGTVPTAEFINGGETQFSLECMMFLLDGNAPWEVASPMYMQANWNSYMGLRQYSGSGGLYFAGYNGGASDVVVGTAATTSALTLNVWHHVRMVADAVGYEVFVDGVSIGSLARANILNDWTNSPTTIKTGGIMGWVDEFIIRSS